MLNRPLSMRGIDLSCGGMRLTSTLDIPTTSLSLCINLPLNDHEINCIAEIVNRDYLNGIKLYGCRFLNLEEIDKKNIRKFVFLEQIRLHSANSQLYGQNDLEVDL
jgi:c-di-GMP-binding flagellar brake protein YcgR